MKFTARAADLRDAIDHVIRVVPKNPSKAVYAGVRLRVRDGSLTVTGSAEGEHTITVDVPVQDAAPGDKVLLPKPLAAYLSTIAASAQVHVAASAGPEMSVGVDGSSPYTFRLMESTYPNTAAPTASTFDADLRELAQAVKAVRAVAADSKLVQLVSTPHATMLQVTDGKRIARATLGGVHLGTFTGLLPLNVLEQMGENPATRVALDKRGRVFSAANDTTTITARVIEDMYPPVESFLDATPPYGVAVPARAVLKALTRLSSVAAGRHVVVSIVGDQMTLSTDSSSTGSGLELVELPTPSASEFTFGVQLEYLREAVAAHPAAEVRLGWTAPDKAVFVTSDETLPITVLFMPIVRPRG